MPSIYRKSWTAPNGWGYQLDIIPYDAAWSDTVVTLSAADALLVEVGTIVDKFDDLPIGLVTPASLTLKVVLNRLPSALQTYLRTKQSGTARNTFVLQTNGGASDETILFCGVQSKINSTTYERSNGNYIVELELVDALQWVMASNKPADSATWASWSPSGTSYQYAIEYRGQGNDDYYDSIYDPRLASGGYQHYFNSWNATFDKISDAIDTVTKTDALRGTVAVNAFDRNSVWEGTSALAQTIFYEQNEVTNANPRVRGTALTNSTALLSTHVRTVVGSYDTGALVYSEQTVGGLTAAGDKYGWSKYESWWDLFKDLCEGMFLKASYTYTRASGLSVEWRIKPVLETSTGNIAFDTSLDEPETTETEAAIGKAEVRWESEYTDADVLQFVANADVARADRSFNVQTVLHNSVIFKGIRDQDSPAWGTECVGEAGLYHTNLIWFADGGSGQWRTKAHENVRIFWGSGASEYLDFNESTISGRPPKDREQHPAWCAAVQAVTGLPYALAQAYVQVFGRDALATVKLRFPITAGIRRVGQRYAITGDITTDIPHLAWSNAVITEITTDIIAGDQAITFTLIPDPA